MKTKRFLALLLLIATLLLSLTSCEDDACIYAKERNVKGHDIHYVEISFEDIGKVTVLLDATTAPETVENFLTLVRSGFYDGLTLHRIIENFMIQGGDPKGNGTGGSANTIKGEFKDNGHENDISHLYGVISMARSNDHDSASSQFFICNADATSLDGKYAAFGYVVDGLSVISEVTTTALSAVSAYYGSDYISWLYYGNGAIPADIQPRIEYIKELTDYKK